MNIQLCPPSLCGSDKTKNIFKDVVFDYSKFNLESFIHFIMENFHFHTNSTYSVLIKIGVSSNSIYYMLGSQIGISIKENHAVHAYKNIYDVILLQIDDLLSKYDLDYYPDSIIISYKAINVPKKLVKFNINSIVYNKTIIKKKEKKKIFRSDYLPLTLDNNQYGFLVENELKYNYLEQLKMNILNRNMLVSDLLNNNELINKSNIFIKNINPNKDSNKMPVIILNINYEDYLNYYLQHKNKVVTDTKNSNLAKIIETDNLSSKDLIRIVYDLNTGICISESVDIIKNENVFIRKIDNITLTINNSTNEVIDLSRSIKIDNIKSSKYSPQYMSNPNIGVLDVETFVNSQGESQVYNIGYSTLAPPRFRQSQGRPDDINYFYLTDNSVQLNSDMLIINCINSMLEFKFNKFYFYIHNMGKFDIVYLYKTLVDYNLQSNKECYKLITMYKDNKMLRLVIKRKMSNNKYIKITFVDSYNILAGSLNTLTKDFNVKYSLA